MLFPSSSDGLSGRSLMTNAQTILLPKGWPKVVRSGVLPTSVVALTALAVL